MFQSFMAKRTKLLLVKSCLHKTFWFKKKINNLNKLMFEAD